MKKVKKVAIIGHFGFGKQCVNGQTIKTKILAEQLEKIYGCDEVIKIDSHGGVKTLLKSPMQVVKALRQSQNLIFLPAPRGIRVYVPLIAFFNRFKKRKVHHVFIGGWHPTFLLKHKWIAKSLKKIDGNYPETASVKQKLEKQGFQNVHVLQNFKELTILSNNAFLYDNSLPYRLCTFSRVLEKKGIGDAIEAVKTINERFKREAFTLDIYGPVDLDQKEWFEKIMHNSPGYIKYKGEVPFTQSTVTLKTYHSLLFPTKFYTEGVPGTIIDAYASGIPVLSSRWESFSDVVEEGITGYGYEFNNTESLVELLEKIMQNPDMLNSLKVNCVEKAKKFTPEYALKDIISRLG